MSNLRIYIQRTADLGTPALVATFETEPEAYNASELLQAKVADPNLYYYVLRPDGTHYKPTAELIAFQMDYLTPKAKEAVFLRLLNERQARAARENPDVKWSLNLRAACHIYNLVEEQVTGKIEYSGVPKSEDRLLRELEALLDENFVRKEQVAALKQERDDLAAALLELCQLKEHKDTIGKDSEYQRRQPVAWERALDLLKALAAGALTWLFVMEML